MPNNNEPGIAKARSSSAGAGKWERYQHQQSHSHLEWGVLDAKLIGELVQEVTRSGDAVLLGTSRDGGTLVITICSGDQRIKFYASSAEQAESRLQELIAQAKT
jgi:hypothetical protein